MKTITYSIKKTAHDLSNFCNCKPLYIDIETTGLSSKNSMIYLVGLLYIKKEELILTQYLCEKEEDEYELLFTLNNFISKYDTLIHYNGNSFDIPFIKKRLAMYSIKENLSKLTSIDFFGLLRPLKTFLGTENLKLPTIMDLLNCKRLDPFNGGQLIEIFKYFVLGDKPLGKVLLLHNEEDMIGLYEINNLLPLLLFKHQYLCDNLDLLSVKSYSLENNFVLSISMDFKNTINLKREMKLTDTAYIKYYNNTISIIFTKHTSKLKFFYLDYKDYYYLPDEDYAIHKSVASFMSKQRRIKATKKTAYTYKNGTFIECPISFKLKNSNINKYYNSTSNKLFYISIEDLLNLDKLTLKNLTLSLIDSFL